MAVWNEIMRSELPSSLRLDPEYYRPNNFQLLSHLTETGAVPIGQFADVTDGIHGSPEWVEHGEGINYLSAKTVKDNFITLAAAGQINKRQHDANPRTAARVGDVLLTTVGTIGNAAVVEDDILPANMDRHLGIIRIRGDVDPYYLSAFLNSQYGRFQTLREATGNVQLNLFVDAMKWLLVPTGEKYNTVGDIVRQARAKRESAAAFYAAAERLLHDALGLDTLDLSHTLTYEGTFEAMEQAQRMDAEYFQPKYAALVNHMRAVAPIEQMGEWNRILKGRSPGDYTSEGIPVLRSGDLVDIDERKGWLHTPPGAHLFLLQGGDVCISSIGFGSIGKVQVYEKQLDTATGMQDCATVSEVTVVRQQRVNPYYLQVFLQSQFGQMQIEHYITGATGQLHLYPRDVAKVFVPMLATEIQQECEDKVWQAKKAKAEAAALLAQAKARVEALITQ